MKTECLSDAWLRNLAFSQRLFFTNTLLCPPLLPQLTKDDGAQIWWDQHVINGMDDTVIGQNIGRHNRGSVHLDYTLLGVPADDDVIARQGRDACAGQIDRLHRWDHTFHDVIREYVEQILCPFGTGKVGNDVGMELCKCIIGGGKDLYGKTKQKQRNKQTRKRGKRA